MPDFAMAQPVKCCEDLSPWCIIQINAYPQKCCLWIVFGQLPKDSVHMFARLRPWRPKVYYSLTPQAGVVRQVSIPKQRLQPTRKAKLPLGGPVATSESL